MAGFTRGDTTVGGTGETFDDAIERIDDELVDLDTRLDVVEVSGPHSHTNKAVLDLITSAGSGDIITAVERFKLSTIEDNATADQTGSEIKIAYEAEANTNAFTDFYVTKLDSIDANATDDQTGAEIKAAYEAEADTNAFTDAEQVKLSGIEANASGDQTGAEIKAAYEAEADTNVFDDAAVSTLASALQTVALNDNTDVTLGALSGEELLRYNQGTGQWVEMALGLGRLLWKNPAGTLEDFAPPFNGEFAINYQAGDVAQTTSATLTTAASLATASSRAGQYMIIAAYGWNHDDAGTDFVSRVLVQGLPKGRSHRQEPKDIGGAGAGGTDQWHLAIRPILYTHLADGPLTVDLQYASSSAGDNTGIGDTFLFALRIGD